MGNYKTSLGQALVTHACNPSYPGGKDQQDCGSKPAGANSLWDPIPSQKRAGRVAQDEGPEFKPQYRNKTPFISTYNKFFAICFYHHLTFIINVLLKSMFQSEIPIILKLIKEYKRCEHLKKTRALQ
jgi:hypothetical protein